MRRLISLATVLALTFSLAGCSMSSGNDSSSPGGGYPEVMPDGGSTDSGYDPEAGVDRSVIKNAYAYLTTENPAEVAEEISSIASSVSGRVDQKNIYTNQEGIPIRADLLLRIPSQQLDFVISKLETFGSVESLEVSATDVTLTVRDLEARVQVLETSVQRLLDLLERASTTSELIDIETALTSRQAELDSLKSTLNFYRDQVSYSTLSLTIVTEADALPNQPDTFWKGLVAGWKALVGFGSALLVALGVSLPWLVVVGILAGGVLWVISKGKKKAPSSKSAKNRRS
jgi:hypothetical protein